MSNGRYDRQSDEQRANHRLGDERERYGARERHTGERRDHGGDYRPRDDDRATYGYGDKYIGSHPQKEFERGDRGYGENPLGFGGGPLAYERKQQVGGNVGGYGDARGRGRVESPEGGDAGAGRNTGPFTGRGPKGYQRSADRVREDVCDELSDHGELDAREVEVRVEGCEVTLEGTVTSRQQKRLAEDLAHQVRGVTDVHNHLRIERTPDEATEREDGTQASLRH